MDQVLSVTFSNKEWGFVYTVRQSLINWPLARGFFGNWDAA